MSDTAEKKAQERTLRDLVETVFRHRRKALVFFAAVTLSALIVLAFTPATYTSTSKLLLRRGRESVFLDPTAATGETPLPLYKEWESEMNSELEILNSRELVVQVVNSLGTAVFLDDVPTDETGKLGLIRKAFDPVRRFFKEHFALSEKKNGRKKKQVDSVIEMVEKNLQIGVRHKSDIITVTYTANSPELAQMVVNELVNKYLERRMNLYRIPGAQQFFNQQTELLMNEMQKNEDQMLAIKEKSGGVLLNTDSSALQTMIEKLHSDQLTVQAELASAKARVGTVQDVLSHQSATDRGAVLNSVDYKKLQSDLRLEEVTLSALVAKNAAIETQLAQLRKELVQVKEQETSVRRLQREQELLEEKYRKYSENREQARINQELETRKISNITIIQQAILPDRSNPSGKLLKLVAALFLGLIGAIATAFGADYMDPALYSAAAAVERTKRTVLAELPRMKGRELDPAWQTPVRKERRGLQILHSATAGVGNDGDCFQELYFRFLSLRSPHAKKPLVIGLTGSIGGEGISTIAGRLAAAFSRDGRFPNVLLLDTNPTEHSSQLVKQRTDLPFTFRQVCKADDPVDASVAIQHLNQARQEDYDIIVVDIPPLNEGGFAIRVAAEPDLTALVVDCGRTPWRAVKRTADLLDHSGADLCGLILNRQQHAMPGWLYSRL